MACRHLAALPLALVSMMTLTGPASAGVRTFPFSYPYDNPGSG